MNLKLADARSEIALESQTRAPNGEGREPAEVVPIYPDLEYAWKVAKRQGVLAFLSFFIVLGCALPIALMTKNTYTSAIVAVEDRRDSVELRTPGLSGSRGDSFLVEFQQRFDSPDFLKKLGELLESQKGEGASTAKKQSFLTVVSDSLKRLFGMEKSTLKKGETSTVGDEQSDAAIESQTDEEQAVIASLRERLVATPDMMVGTMKLETYGDSPADARALASTGMDLFIQTQLGIERDKLKLKSGFLKKELVRARDRLLDLRNRNARNEAWIAGVALPTQPKENAQAGGGSHGKADPDMQRMREKEAELQNKITLMETDYTSINNERLQNRLKLESEYKLLQARLQPEHPDLQAKRTEIITYAATPTRADELQGTLRKLRQELWEIKGKLLSLPRLMERSQLTAEEKQESGLVATLTDRIGDLDLEHANIERQLAEPALRTRISVVKPATYDLKPFNNKRKKALIGAIVLAIAAGLLVFFGREVRNPLARDAWRVFWRTRQPILTQVSKASMKAFPRITPSIADDLRAALGQEDSASRSKSRALLAYRRLELTIHRACRGRVILFVSAGPQDQLGNFFYSLLNLISTDTLGRCVLVDCNHLDPVLQVQSDKQGLADFLKGNVESSKIVVLRHPNAAFDLIPPVQNMTGEKTRVFQKALLERFFARLRERYDYVFVRGLPESHFIENAALIEAATDCIVCIDSGKTTYTQLDRSLVHLENEKVRGLVMLGT